MVPIDAGGESIGGTRTSRNLLGLTVWVLLLLGLLFAAPDMQFIPDWDLWIQRAREFGPFFAFHADPNAYPPGAVTTLWVADLVLPITDTQYVVKVLNLVLLVATSAALGLWTRRWGAAWLAVPALGIEAVAHGALDIFFILPLVLALWALQRHRWAWFSFLFAVSTMLKWQPMIVAPILAVFVVKELIALPDARQRVRMTLQVVVPAAVVYGLTIYAFWFDYVFSSVHGATQQNMLSGLALNFGWVLSAFAVASTSSFAENRYLFVDEVPAWMPLLSQLLFVVAYFTILVAFIRARVSFAKTLVAAQLVALVYFLFGVGAHSNHLMVAVPISMGIIWLVPIMRTDALIVVLMANVSIIAFGGFAGVRPALPFTPAVDPTTIVAALFVVIGVYLVCRGIRYLDPFRSLPGMTPQTSVASDSGLDGNRQ